MSPREFLTHFEQDRRLVTGAFFSRHALAVEPGDRVGVVMMNLGGPEGTEDVEPFLYNLFMDPAVIDIPLPGFLRDRLCKLIAKKRAEVVAEGYEVIGGGAPLNPHSRDQARALERRLNDRFGPVTGATFSTYLAMRYWVPFSEDAARRMREDRVDKVILLPLYPQYSKTTTGASLSYWKALEETEEIPTWPTSLVSEYAAHPKFIEALSNRIDEGLQRFPRDVRDKVHLLFSAHGTPLKELLKRRDPYCCLVHSTVQQVMNHREGHDSGRAFHTAFQSKIGPAKWLEPSTPDQLEEMADAGHKAVLVIPVAFVSDHIETAYELDIAVREEAVAAGIEHYEVTSGLNCHPLFIEALAEAVAAQISPQRSPEGNGVAAEALLPSEIPTLPRYKVAERTVRCQYCPLVCEAASWESEAAVRVPPPSEPALSASPRTNRSADATASARA